MGSTARRALVALLGATLLVQAVAACSEGSGSDRDGATTPSASGARLSTADPADQIDLNESVLEGSFVRRRLSVGQEIDVVDLRAVLRVGLAKTPTVRVELDRPGGPWDHGTATTRYDDGARVRTELGFSDSRGRVADLGFLVADGEYFVAVDDHGYSRIPSPRLDEFGITDRRFWPLLASDASYNEFADALGTARYLGPVGRGGDGVRRFRTTPTTEVGFYLVGQPIGEGRDLEFSVDDQGRLHEVRVLGEPEIVLRLRGWGRPVRIEPPAESDLVPLPGDSAA